MATVNRIDMQVTAKNLRVRKRNEFESFILDKDLKKIDNTQGKRDLLLRKEIRSIQQEMDRIKELYGNQGSSSADSEEKIDKNMRIKAVKSAPQKLQTSKPSARASAYRNMVQSKAASYKSLPLKLDHADSDLSDSDDADDAVGHVCKYNPGSPRCIYFPCTIPPKYHSIGYRLPSCKLNTKSAVKNRGTMGLPKAWDDFFDGENESHYNSLTRPLQSTSSERPYIRERALKKIVAEMRRKNSTTQPTDWNINYGTPIPRRRILKPPKVVSLGAGVFL